MRLAFLLVLLAACGGGGSGGSGSGGNATAKQACVSEANYYRAMNGKPALTESARLEAYADIGAAVDFSSSPHNHFSTTQGGGIAFAENECPVQGHWMLPQGGDMVTLVKQCVKAFYDEGPGGGHYENMMGNYGALGCGIYQQDTGVTIVQDYGN
jgi:hypothetical protein